LQRLKYDLALLNFGVVEDSDLAIREADGTRSSTALAKASLNELNSKSVVLLVGRYGR